MSSTAEDRAKDLKSRNKEGWTLLRKLCDEAPCEKGAEGRFDAFRESAKELRPEDVPEFLTMATEAVASVADESRALKKRRTEEAMRIMAGGAKRKVVEGAAADDDSDDEAPAADKAADKGTTKTVLEDKMELKKRVLAKKYLDEVGGKKCWLFTPGLKAFLANPSLPSAFSDRLVGMINTSVYSVRVFEIMKRGNGKPSVEELALLGEMIYAEQAASVFLLYAAWYKTAHEDHHWADAALTDALAEQSKTLVGLALRDVAGGAIGTTLGATSVGDIFDTKKDSTDKQNAGGGDRGGLKNTLPKKVAGGVTTPSWLQGKPNGFQNFKNKGSCSACKGYGHGAKECIAATFSGYCSKCFGLGHQAKACPTK